MIICARCGERSPADAQFCGECGAFLEWEGAPEERPQAVPATPGQPAAAQVGAPGPATTLPADTRPTGTPQAGTPQAGTPQAGTPQAGDQPAAVQPDEQRRRPRHPLPPRPADEPPPAHGDLICGQCGKGNTPTRRFCGRCGASLEEAEVVSAPWWRRLVRPRGPRVRRQGSRPGRDGIRRTGVRLGELVRQVFRALRAVVALAAVLALLLYATYAPFRGQVNSQAMMVVSKVQGIFVTRYVPVHPVKVTATAEQPGHPAALVADNATNTYWSAATGGVEPALVLTFDHPVDLRRALVRVGVGSDFQSTHRPQRLHLVYSTGKTDDVSLTDTPDQQEVALGNSAGATSVELHVVSLFRSLRGNDVAISEIELFERG